MQIVKITWIDAQRIDVGLQPIENLKDTTPVECEIVGFLVNETKDTVILAQEHWKDDVMVKYINAIPKCLIKKRVVLEENK